MSTVIRPIHNRDILRIENIIKTILEEHDITMPGTAYHDESLKNMYKYYTGPNRIYFVAFDGDEMLGGAGIYPTDGLPDGTCELVKMYILKEARGKGLGKMLINKCIEFAKEAGFTKIYLETMPALSKAIGMYENSGFTLLKESLGNSGHFACEVRMLKEI